MHGPLADLKPQRPLVIDLHDRVVIRRSDFQLLPIPLALLVHRHVGALLALKRVKVRVHVDSKTILMDLLFGIQSLAVGTTRHLIKRCHASFAAMFLLPYLFQVLG